MKQALPGPEHLSRPQAIAVIRERLGALCDDFLRAVEDYGAQSLHGEEQ